MYLFFDTETTGKPKTRNASPSDLWNWPRIVQIAWVITDEQGNEIEADDYIVKPDGFDIPLDAVEIHNITTERALNEGFPLQKVLSGFSMAINKAKLLIAHNINFDKPVTVAEYLRMELPHKLNEISTICTMLSSTNFCKIPGFYDDYKWPKLEELHKKLFNSNFKDSHNASVDIKACVKCFFELKKRGIIKVPDVVQPSF